MAQSTQVRCDACEADLTETGEGIKYRLSLSNQMMLTRKGGNTAPELGEYPKLPAEGHFCGLPCLAVWMERVHPNAVAAQHELLQLRAEKAEEARQAAQKATEESEKAGEG